MSLSKSMMQKAKKLILLLLLTLCGMLGGAWETKAADYINLTGAGATFPYPLYSKWFDVYTKVDPSVRINYQSIGSGGGIRQISEKTVDFGATDGFMSDELLKKAKGGSLLHIPTAAGAVVVIYNLSGVSQGLKITPEVLADIFLGKIKSWDDPKITALNPGAKLSKTSIVVVHRSDGSGTTAIFTDYLSNVSSEWKTKVGKGTSVNWPAGIGGKGNEGVAGQVKQTPGAIGYAELAYALQNKLAYAFIKNQAGEFVEPTLGSTTAALAGAAAAMPDDMRVSIVNPAGKGAYPISGLTWLLVYQNQEDEKKGKALVNFLRWAIHEGQKYEKDLHYASLPAEVVKKVEKQIKSIKYQGKPLWAGK